MIDRLVAEVAELQGRLGQPPKAPGDSSELPSVGLWPDPAGRGAGGRGTV